MTRILILGQRYFAARVARILNSRSADVRATFVPERDYVGLLAKRPRSERVVLIRVGYRPGASTLRGLLFDKYWSLLRRLQPNALPCHLWLGTDVLNTVEEAQAGTLRWSAFTSTRDDLHLAVAPWLTSELVSVGIRASTALLPPPNPAPPEAPPLPAAFSVLTYLPSDRFDFYGGPTILEVAQRLPGVRFDIIGNRGEHIGASLTNVHWHGWVSDMAQVYARTTAVVRIPRHDGFGNTVIEGLQNARHVIYSHEVPFVRTVSPATTDSIVTAVTEFRDAHASGRLSPNLAGRRYALEVFDEMNLADHLLALLQAKA